MTNRCGGSPCAGPPSWCARSRVACAVVSLIGSLLIGTDCRESLAPHGVDRNGGTVRSPDRVATLEIPEGALSQTTQSTVSPESDSAGHGVLVAGTVYDFQPSGLQFAQPARLIIKYDPARLPAGVGPSQLKLMRSDSVWEQVPGSTVDSANETVWAGERRGRGRIPSRRGRRCGREARRRSAECARGSSRGASA